MMGQFHRFLRDSRGSVLIAVLMMVAIVVTLLTEFTYGVYVSSHSITYINESQRLTPIARSGLVLSTRLLTEVGDLYNLSPAGYITMPVEKVTDQFDGSLVVTAYDENGRFNLNSLVYQNGQYNPANYEGFKRLLVYLGLQQRIADCIVDYLDRDREERYDNAEEGSKNQYLDTIDEIYQIACLKGSDIDTMINYVTVYGYDRRDSSVININSAPIPVIMTIDERITRDLAERIVNYRNLEPFKNSTDILKVSGFEGALGQSMLGKIAVKVRNMRIVSSAEQNGIRRIIETVVELRGRSHAVRYWREI
ncbi:MAG: type II secretion system protein GspK [Thermodesulfovibrionales bacterium]